MMRTSNCGYNVGIIILSERFARIFLVLDPSVQILTRMTARQD